jgi:hypothetical protein
MLFDLPEKHTIYQNNELWYDSRARMLEKYGRFFLQGHWYPNNKVNPEDTLLEEIYDRIKGSKGS